MLLLLHLLLISPFSFFPSNSFSLLNFFLLLFLHLNPFLLRNLLFTSSSFSFLTSYFLFVTHFSFSFFLVHLNLLIPVTASGHFQIVSIILPPSFVSVIPLPCSFLFMYFPSSVYPYLVQVLYFSHLTSPPPPRNDEHLKCGLSLFSWLSLGSFRPSLPSPSPPPPPQLSARLQQL
jgi:hypothetical protein